MSRTPTRKPTTTKPVQHSVSSGPSLYDEFASYAPSTDVTARPLSQRIIAIIAPAGEGKSALLQSIPNCIIIDCDQKGASNPKPRALLLPDPTKPISIPNPRDPEKTINEFNFDYCRAVVARAVAVKKANPDQEVMVAFDTVPALIEHRIRKLEVDRGDADKGVIMNFADMNAMEVWPIIARSCCDLIDDCKNVGIGVILSLHIVQDKETKFIKRQRETVSTEKVNISNSVEKALKIRLNEAWRLRTSVETTTPMVPMKGPGGKVLTTPDGKQRLTRGTPVTTKKFHLIIDKFDETDQSIRDFCKVQLPTLPIELTWDSGNFDPWTTVVQPAYEKAIEEFNAGESSNGEASDDDSE